MAKTIPSVYAHGAAWIGVDLDGTLVKYIGWQGPGHIGEPIEPMWWRVRRWLDEGKRVKIFTARVSHDGTPARIAEAALAEQVIKRWTALQFGIELEVTCTKDYGMIELWDDRCVQVECNTGRRMDNQPEGIVTS